MLSHVFIGTNDFDRALVFYQALLPALGIKPRFCDTSRPWAAWQSSPDPRPLFILGRPYNQLAHEPGNGQMLALLAADRASVRRAYSIAIQQGGRCAGAPGLRPDYHADYYGAYFYDLDGNKLAVVCHQPEEE